MSARTFLNSEFISARTFLNSEFMSFLSAMREVSKRPIELSRLTSLPSKPVTNLLSVQPSSDRRAARPMLVRVVMTTMMFAFLG